MFIGQDILEGVILDLRSGFRIEETSKKPFILYQGDWCMCDTFVAVNEYTEDNSVIFGKNSDRHPNEPQIIEFHEGGVSCNEELRCTHITIPQVDRVNSVLISRPIWIWGAEMGANDKGVVIGNEAVWTSEQENSDKLIGMDLLRLALERADTARGAIDVIADLLKEFGQGGNCGMYHKDFYDNSFIIADKGEAWVLETAGKYWIAEKVRGIRTISNILTIENQYDLIHPELLEHTIETGRCRDEDDFNFREQYKSRFMSFAAMGDKRRQCTLKVLNDAGKVSIETAMATLRSHNIEGSFNPRKSSMAQPCLHASSLLTPTQSTASMVSHITDHPTHWMTGTSTPCLSVFKPFRMEAFDTSSMKTSRTYDQDSLWWEHEILQRRVIRDYKSNAPLVKAEMEKLELELVKKAQENVSADLTNEALKSHLAEIRRLNSVPMAKTGGIRQLRYSAYWNSLSKKVGMKI